jgi:6-phosphogluconolactonase
MNQHRSLHTASLGILLLVSPALELPPASPLQAQETRATKLYCLLDGENAVALFDVDEAGGLTHQGSYPTGGAGRALSSDQDLEIDAQGRWLLVSNNETHNITVFAINPGGVLTSVPGSPFATGQGPTRMALHPTLDVLYVSHWQDNTVRAFAIAGNGSLSPLQVETVGGLPRDLEVDGSGHHLYVADIGAGVRGYTLSDGGSLAEMPGSPFRFASSRPEEIEVSAAGQQLLAVDLDNGVAAFDIGASGGLTLVSGSPLVVGGFANRIEVTGDDRFAYVGFYFEPRISGFALQPGELPRPLSGSPFPAEPQVKEILISPQGDRLFELTRESRTLRTFAIAEDGSLAPLGDVIPLPGEGLPNGAVLAVLPDLPVQPDLFLRGDSNSDGTLNLTDAIHALNYLFRAGPEPGCLESADGDDNGAINLTDPVLLLNYLFQSGPPLAPPGPDGCGEDPAGSPGFGCRSPAGC